MVLFGLSSLFAFSEVGGFYGVVLDFGGGVFTGKDDRSIKAA